MDNLEEDLTCSVCYALFTDPRVLPCSHTFCKSCLESVLQISANFSIWRPLRLPLKCPNCRSVVELPPNGVDALPINVSLRAIVEKYQLDGGQHARPPACPEHPRQPLNVYCVQDRVLICGLCLTVGCHQGHAIDDLQTAYNREQDAPARLVQQLTDGRWAEVCGLAERLEMEKGRCEALVRQDQEAVEQFFRSVELQLERKRDQYLAALETASAEVASAYDPLIEKLKDMKEEQLSLISLSSAVQDEESPLAFLEKVHTFRARVRSLVQTPMPDVVPLSVLPRASDYLQEHWPSVTIGAIDQGPIPKVTCHIQGCQANQVLHPRVLPRPRMWAQVPLVALLLVVVGLGLYFDPFGVVSHGLSLLTPISELLSGLTKQIVWPFDTKRLLREMLSNAWASISSVATRTYQHITFMFQALQ